MNFLLQLLIILAKFGVALLVVKLPFLGSWANYFLDVVDGDILQFLGMSELLYQNIDKLADYVVYIAMLIVGRKWGIKKEITVLFIYRTLGQLLFFLTHNELVFMYFQNFLEPLFMIYSLLLFRMKSEPKTYAFYKKHWFVIWAIVIAYKVWNEWYLHFANIDLSTFFFGLDGKMVSK